MTGLCPLKSAMGTCSHTRWMLWYILHILSCTTIQTCPLFALQQSQWKPKGLILSFGFCCSNLPSLRHPSHCPAHNIHLVAIGWIYLILSLCKMEIWVLGILEWIWSACSQNYKCLLTIYTFLQVLPHSSLFELGGGSGRRPLTLTAGLSDLQRATITQSSPFPTVTLKAISKMAHYWVHNNEVRINSIQRKHFH